MTKGLTMLKTFKDLKQHLFKKNKKYQFLHALAASGFFIFTLLTTILFYHIQSVLLFLEVPIAGISFLIIKEFFETKQFIDFEKIDVYKMLKEEKTTLPQCYDLIYSLFLSSTLSSLRGKKIMDEEVKECKNKINQFKDKIDYNKAVLAKSTLDNTPRDIQYQFNVNEHEIKQEFYCFISHLIQTSDYLKHSEIDNIINLGDAEKILFIETELKKIEINHAIEKEETQQFVDNLQLNKNNVFKKKYLSL